MQYRIAIHHRENSYSDRWISYCNKNNIDYIVVDCFNNSIIEVLLKEKITHLLWHFHHSSTNDLDVSNYVFNAVEKIGIKTFPNQNTRWHFDDKAAQKYLMESLKIPFAKSYIFYDKREAINEVEKFNYPIVSKLKRGAGSVNVQLINSIKEAKTYVELMFDKGMKGTDSPLNNIDQKIRIARKIKNPFLLIKKIISHIKKVRKESKISNPERGYVYFQEFMPKNDYDTRIIVVGNIAFGIRRFNKTNDFRASGSGKIDYNSSKIDKNFIKLAFQVSKKIGAQCLAYDFIYDSKENPSIIEISYSFSMYAYDDCEGFWDDSLHFYRKKINPQYLMIENLLKS